MSKEGFWDRNRHWLFFLAGIAIAGSKMTFIERFVGIFGDFYAVGYFVVGFGIILLTKIIGRLIPEK